MSDAQAKSKPMTAAEMRQEAKRLQDEADRVEREEKKALRAEVEDLIAKRGYALTDIFPEGKGTRPAPSGTRSRSDLPPTHRDPKNPENTWTGRGRKPNWLVEYMEKGHDPDEFKLF